VDEEVRLATLAAMEQHEIRMAGPFLSLRVRSPAFARMSPVEKRQALSTLATLAPGRTEAICVEMLEDKRLVTSTSHRESCELAAMILGRVGSSQRALDVLTSLAKPRWSNPEKLRAAAAQALERLQQRQAARGKS
jgi:hypothetical protein